MGQHGPGGPASLLLDMWAAHINRAFGPCYLVGSATRTKQWRDVDVVCILNDNEFDGLFGATDHRYGHSINLRWAATCAAFSQWATSATGLPVDFKFQAVTDANARHDGIRFALGLYPSPQPYDTHGTKGPTVGDHH